MLTVDAELLVLERVGVVVAVYLGLATVGFLGSVGELSAFDYGTWVGFLPAFFMDRIYNYLK